MLKLTLKSDNSIVWIDPLAVFAVFPDESGTLVWLGPGCTESLHVRENADWAQNEVRRAKSAAQDGYLLWYEVGRFGVPPGTRDQACIETEVPGSPMNLFKRAGLLAMDMDSSASALFHVLDTLVCRLRDGEAIEVKDEDHPNKEG